jgi:D-alanyl-D-alanine carboxypeptidase (penicillin-binding protein 5/6)
MNRLISAWGLEHTRFNNPSGLTDEGNYSSAADLAKLAKLALTNTTFRQIIAQPEASITDLAGRSFTLKSTNKLLADSRFRGVKTGYTLAAGQSFVGLANVNGHDVITVALNSPDRFAETTQLVNWIEKVYLWL